MSGGIGDGIVLEGFGFLISFQDFYAANVSISIFYSRNMLGFG